MATITTDRLVLRALTEADIPRVLEYRNEPAVTRWLLTTTVDEKQLQAWSADRGGASDHGKAVELDGRLIGTVSLQLADGFGQPGMPKGTEAEVGYVFDPAFGGHGYALEAVQAMVDHAFGTLGVRRLTAGCFADNAASVRLLEKLGMRREQHGLQDSWHAELGWVDGYTYALLQSEWRDRS